MTNGRKKTTAVLAGAVALASAGYAIGSQSGGGVSDAASATPADREAFAAAGYAGSGAGAPGRTERHTRRAGVDDLASRLGVTAEQLRTALEAVREDQRDERQDRPEPFAALADALGKSTAEVEQAFQKLRDQRMDAFAAAVAKELGVDAAKVRAALADAAPGATEQRRGRGPRWMVAGVAEKLGVSASKLRAALRAALPDRDRHVDHAAALAEALGVSEKRLEQAWQEVHESHERLREERRAEFAAALAAELGISADKVEEELGDGPFLGRGRGPGGPGGPGGPHR